MAEMRLARTDEKKIVAIERITMSIYSTRSIDSRVGAGLGDTKHSVYSIAVTSRELIKDHNASRGASNGTTRSAGIGHV